MPDENAPPAVEETNSLENPPGGPPQGVQAPAAPPATKIVVTGTKTEREIELERRLEANERLIRDREMTIAEREREIQGLKEIPAPPKPAKVKRKPGWSDPVFSDED